MPPTPPSLSRRHAAAVIGGGVALGVLPAEAQVKRMPRSVEILNPKSLAASPAYSHVARVRSGDMVFVAGQVALDAAGQLVGPGDFRAQLEQVFKNVDAAVREAGGSFRDVVKLAYFCHQSVEAEQVRAVAEVRGRYLAGATPPTSTFVYVSRLARPEWLIEIEAVAVVGA